MKQFTIITKDGSKWLRPVNPFDPRDVMWQEFNLKEPDLLYLGNHPEGTVLSEEQVGQVVQYRQKDNENADWKIWTTGVIDWDCVIETRIAYTDAESHDIDYEKEMPHKKWPSTKYVARRVDAESHDHDISDDYWRKRCEAAERFIAKSPCDPDITKNQNAAYDAWQEIVKQQPK